MATMTITEHNQPCRRTCFVTIGATAKFDALIQAVLSHSFLKALQALNYTDIVIQHGTEGGELYQAFTRTNPIGSEGRCGLQVNGFDFKKQGLDLEMRSAKGTTKGTVGVVISHAGMYWFLTHLKLKLTLEGKARDRYCRQCE